MSEQPKSSQLLVVGLLVFAGFLNIFNEVEMNIALPTIGALYNVPIPSAQWLTTGFMLITGTLMPLSAFAMGRLGSRKCVLGALTILLAGILISLFAPNFEILLVGRLVQAICAAFFTPVMFAVVMSIAPKEKMGTYNGLMMLVLMAAPAFSPTLSGLILSTLGFKWLFIVLLPFLILVIVLIFFLMSEAIPAHKAKIDLTSVVFSVLGFGGVVYGIGNAASKGFASLEVIVPIIVGVVALVFYTRRQLTSERPLLNLRILGNARYRNSLLIMAAMQLVLFGTILVIPLFLQNAWGLSAMEAGLYMLPGGVVSAFCNLLAGMAYDRFGLKTVPLGLIATAVGYAGIVYTMAFSPSALTFIVFCIIYSGSLPFAITALSSNSLSSLEKEQLPDGSSMNNTLFQIAGSMGTAIFTIIVYQAAGLFNASASSEQLFVSGSTIAMVVAVVIALLVAAAFIALRKQIDPYADL